MTSNTDSSLYQQIQQFYDASSGLWEQVWGEHMHHGYYGPNGTLRKERRQAQIDLIEELLSWAEIRQTRDFLDVGCGIGGSTLYLAQKFQAQGVGVTLSPVQAARARERAQAAGLSQQAQFQVANALSLPFADATFDLVWSLESGEHMPDKAAFLQECYRVMKPGGKLMMATWCHRSTGEGGELTPQEQALLAEIYRVYCLPYVIALPEYCAIAQTLAFKNIRSVDWSTAVAPFWDLVIESALNPMAWIGLILSGWKTIEAALSLGLMQRGFQTGLIRYGVLVAEK